MEILYKIYYNMAFNYDDKYGNYEISRSLNNIKHNKIFQNLKDINEIENIKDKIGNIMNIYDKMNFSDEINIIYKIDYNAIKDGKIKIFDKDFVDNNKNFCKIIFNEKEYNLTSEFDIKNINENKLKIK